MSFRYKKNFVDLTSTKCDDIIALSKTKKRPVEFQNPSPELKAKFKEWCAKPDTDHAFITLCVGDNPNFPISENNPLREFHGIIADYDAMPPSKDFEKLIDINCSQNNIPKPTYISTSFSGYPRALWLTEDPVTLTGNLYSSVYKRLDAKLGISGMFPGWDKGCLKPSLSYEIGTDWKKIGEPLKQELVMGALYAASADSPEKTEGPKIPFDVVYDKIQDKYPNRLTCTKEDFVTGIRMAAFMVDPFKPESTDSCILQDEGIMCFTTRSPKAFWSWRDLFGKEFVEGYEENRLTTILSTYWTNGEKFFKKSDTGVIDKINKQTLELELKIAGFSPRRDRLTGLSDMDRAIDRINNRNRIDCIAPVIFSTEEQVYYESKRILNDSRLQILEAAEDGDPKNWPWLYSFFNQFFAKDVDVDQLLVFFSWLSWARKSLQIGDHRKLRQSQCLILSGDPGTGKSLTSGGIISPLLGGSAPASRYLAGKTPFNGELAHFACWLSDDNSSAASAVDQRRLDETVKATVANRYLPYEAKYFEPTKLPFAPKVVMTVNTDAASMSSIPNLDQATLDKIVGLVISKDAFIDFPEDLDEILESELPAFAKFIDDFETPKNLKGTARFGIKAFIHPTISKAAYDNSRKSQVAELVEIFVDDIRSTYPDNSDKSFTNEWWKGTVTSFQQEFLLHRGGTNVGCINRINEVKEGLQNMEQQSRLDDNIRPIRATSVGSGTRYEILLDKKYDFCEENTSTTEPLEV